MLVVSPRLDTTPCEELSRWKPHHSASHLDYFRSHRRGSPSRVTGPSGVLWGGR
jgi:hypothetical protein